MAITLADFNKIWASTSPLTPYSFSESNYKQGWNFIGSTPPARQMWDFLQKNNDEKMQYLANNYLPLTGGTMIGSITASSAVIAKRTVDTDSLVLFGGSGLNNGASFYLFGKDESRLGGFWLNANNGTINKRLVGLFNGTLTWDGMSLVPVYTNIYSSHTFTTTGYEYTGGNVTIPANSIYSYRFEVLFSNSKPLGGYVALASDDSFVKNIAWVDNPNLQSNHLNMYVCGYTPAAQTLYLFGKHGTASKNDYLISGWYQKLA